MKKGLSLFLAMMMVFSTVVFAKPSAIVTYDSAVESTTENAALSSEMQYIYTAQELYNIRNNPDGNYYLMNDIDLSHYSSWLPIAHDADGTVFTGTFDGQGYAITGLTINIDVDTDSTEDLNYHLGLFGNLGDGAVIKNLTVECDIDVDVSSAEFVMVRAGALAGTDFGASIENCTASGDINVRANSNNYYANCNLGGLIGGKWMEADISDCTSSVNITAVAENITGTDSVVHAGGIVGSKYTGGNIQGCTTTGNINVTTLSNGSAFCVAGGVTGMLSAGLIDNCKAEGNVTAVVSSNVDENYADCYVGGLVGLTDIDVSINNCIAKGNVTGSATGASTCDAGGLVGNCGNNAVVENCAAFGDVVGTATSGIGVANATSGGLIGVIGSDGTIKNSYARGGAKTNAYAEIFRADSRVGGFVGAMGDGVTAQNCYSTAWISEDISAGFEYDSYAGAFVGYKHELASLTSCYYNRDASGLPDSYATALYSYEAVEKESYMGFDFTNVWAIDEDINDAHPYLLSHVPAVKVTGVSLNKTSAVLRVDDTLTLVATVLPLDAANKNVTWSSDNETVATVVNGVVTAKAKGTAVICVTTEDGSKTATCNVTVNAKDLPPVEADAVFTIGNVGGRPGDTIKVPVTLENEKTVNSISLSGFVYDENTLEFVGFETNEDFIADALFKTFDEERMTAIIGWQTSGVYSGKICDVVFKIKDTALEGEYGMSVTPNIKNNKDVISFAVNEGKVTVRYQILGDIDLNEGIDINDAILLFQHSMMPAVYEIDYVGSLDFNKDGGLDINDAILLFQHSMMPEIYPLA